MGLGAASHVSELGEPGDEASDCFLVAECLQRLAKILFKKMFESLLSQASVLRTFISKLPQAARCQAACSPEADLGSGRAGTLPCGRPASWEFGGTEKQQITVQECY